MSGNGKNVNKKVLNGVTIALALGCIGLVWFLGNSIYAKYTTDKTLIVQERKVKDQLKMIKRAQEMYYLEKDTYANSWENLINFVKEGQLFSIERNEKIVLLESGRESIEVSYDTIAGPFSVADSLFPPRKYPDFDLNSLNLVPEMEIPFILRTDTLEGISVFEVVDPKPVDPNKQNGEADTLKIGSLVKVTTAGNWEK